MTTESPLEPGHAGCPQDLEGPESLQGPESGVSCQTCWLRLVLRVGVRARVCGRGERGAQHEVTLGSPVPCVHRLAQPM